MGLLFEIGAYNINNKLEVIKIKLRNVGSRQNYKLTSQNIAESYEETRQ